MRFLYCLTSIKTFFVLTTNQAVVSRTVSDNMCYNRFEVTTTMNLVDIPYTRTYNANLQCSKTKIVMSVQNAITIIINYRDERHVHSPACFFMTPIAGWGGGGG